MRSRKHTTGDRTEYRNFSAGTEAVNHKFHFYFAYQKYSSTEILGNGSKWVFFVYPKNLLKQQLIILKYFNLPHLQLSHKCCPKLPFSPWNTKTAPEIPESPVCVRLGESSAQPNSTGLSPWEHCAVVGLGQSDRPTPHWQLLSHAPPTHEYKAESLDWYLNISTMFHPLFLVCAAAQDLPSTGPDPSFDAVPGIKTQTAHLVPTSAQTPNQHMLLNRHLMATESNQQGNKENT